MLGGAAHSHKVNFCKFTNETRNAFEAAEEESGQKYIAAVKGACAGGGYELALACNHIMLTDDLNPVLHYQRCLYWRYSGHRRAYACH